MNKVLIVDDEEAILKGIKLNLGREFSISTAKESQEALEIVREQGPFDVVVSDMRMPGMDGATLLRTIKEENPQIMTILLTGHADFEFGGSQALQTGYFLKSLTNHVHHTNFQPRSEQRLTKKREQIREKKNLPKQFFNY